jgi:hypothetical protein
VGFTADVAKEVVNALTTVTGGIVFGANAVVGTAGSATEQFGDMFDVYAKQVFQGAGGAAKYVADEMGRVLRKIPTVGNGVAYVVESVGGGVFHVVVAVGTLGGSVVRRAGQVARKSSDLVVYTLTAANHQARDTGAELNAIVGQLGMTISGR